MGLQNYPDESSLPEVLEEVLKEIFFSHEI